MAQKKLTIKVEEGHLIIDDGCLQQLTESPMQNPCLREMDNCFVKSAPEEKRRRHLFRLNVSLVSEYLADYVSDFTLVCPICHERYQLSKEDCLNVMGKEV